MRGAALWRWGTLLGDLVGGEGRGVVVAVAGVVVGVAVRGGIVGREAGWGR